MELAQSDGTHSYRQVRRAPTLLHAKTLVTPGSGTLLLWQCTGSGCDIKRSQGYSLKYWFFLRTLWMLGNVNFKIFYQCSDERFTQTVKAHGGTPLWHIYSLSEWVSCWWAVIINLVPLLHYMWLVAGVVEPRFSRWQNALHEARLGGTGIAFPSCQVEASFSGPLWNKLEKKLNFQYWL